MLVLLSPAKKMDLETDAMRESYSEPRLLQQSEKLIKKAKTLKASDLQAMMGVSENIADLNVARFKAFKTPFTLANAKQALDAFKGDVYVGLDAETLNDADAAFAQKHIRILSGLYGLLRPLDLIQAYRLEMGIKFATDKGSNLYHFWGETITDLVNEDLKAGDLINLASGEYFKAIKAKKIKGRIITPVFKDMKNGQAKVISFFAKKARGMMARYIIDKRLEDASLLKKANVGGYRYQPNLSNDDTWVFLRDES